MQALCKVTLILDADDLLVLVPPEHCIPVEERPILRIILGTNAVQDAPELVDVIEHRRTSQHERAARVHGEARLSTLRLWVLQVVRLIEDRHIKHLIVEKLKVRINLFVVDNQNLRAVHLSEL